VLKFRICCMGSCSSFTGKLAEVRRQAAILAGAKEMWQRGVIAFKFQARYFTPSEQIRAAHCSGTPCGGPREGFICEVHIDSLRHFGAPM